jgi:ribosome biogenesis GTPase A
MTHSLYNCVTPVFNISKKVLFPCSVRFRNVTSLWKTVKVRFVGGIAEGSTVADRRDLLLSKSESFVKRNENYESRLLKIAIIGVPNVGKSTVINQLLGRKVFINQSPILACIVCKVKVLFIYSWFI